jgi:hypothetical protein
MKRLLIGILVSLLTIGCEKDLPQNIVVLPNTSIIKIDTTPKPPPPPTVPAVNMEMFPQINWNDVVSGKNTIYDFNGDGTPDLVSYKFMNNNSPLPPIFEVKDYSGKTIFSFNIKESNPTVRDSLNGMLYDFADINGDGNQDIILGFFGEWWFGGTPGSKGSVSKFYGTNTYLLLSKGNMKFDVIEIMDEPNNNFFNVNIFDWDFDGDLDILLGRMDEGNIYENIGNNKFQMSRINPLYSQAISNKFDFNKDGKIDFINLFVRQMGEFGNYNRPTAEQTLSVVTNKGVLNFPVVGKTILKSIYITANTISNERIALIDGDGDGDTDLIVGGLITENNIYSYFQDYYENTGSQFEYRDNYIEVDKELIGQLQSWTYDIDNDGDLDLFYPTYNRSKLTQPKNSYFWWENTKKGFKINKTFNLKY